MSVLGTGSRLSGPRPDQGFQSVRTANMLPLPSTWTYEAELLSKARILRFWDKHEYSSFLLTPAWARGTDISPRVLYKHLLLHRWATWAKAWVGVEAKISKPRHHGHKGVSMFWYRRLTLQISMIYRVRFRSQNSVV